MQNINALSLTSAVNDWLTNSHHPRILHIFDGACNLINEHREVLSIVTPQIGDGPFNMVIGEDICFAEHLSLQSPVSFSATQLHLGSLTICTEDVKLWNPCPDWKTLHNQKENILSTLTQLPFTYYSNPILQFSNSLLSAFASADPPSSLAAAKQLAGLGIGLTPSGDDFIIGALYASWIIHPFEIAFALAKEIAEAAAPLTTSLSAAWLRSAGRGEAGILWHDLFNALIAGEDLQLPITNLLTVGETSGADALAGFFGVMSAFKDIIEKCPS